MTVGDSRTLDSLTTEARRIHDEALVVDLHADTASLMRMGYDLAARHRPLLPASALGYHVDLPRMIEGGQTGQVFGLVTFPWKKRGLMRIALRQIHILRKAAASSPLLWYSPDGSVLRQAKAEDKIVAMPGLEGVHALEGKLENLDVLAAAGLRMCGLVHFSANEAARPAWGRGADPDAGLSAFGRDLVERSNELGVILDLAHLNKKGFLETIHLSTAPVVVSHTGLQGVHDMWRNIDDEQIRAVADAGGAIGIIYHRNFLGGRTIDAVVRHIVHCWKVGGEDTPALGSDFDGFIIPPKDLPDCSALPLITQALLDHDVPERIIHKILGANALRVFEAVPPKAFTQNKTDAL